MQFGEDRLAFITEPRPHYVRWALTTGRWGVEAFKGESTRERTMARREPCYPCHTAQKDKDYVFSSARP